MLSFPLSPEDPSFLQVLILDTCSLISWILLSYGLFPLGSVNHGTKPGTLPLGHQKPENVGHGCSSKGEEWTSCQLPFYLLLNLNFPITYEGDRVSLPFSDNSRDHIGITHSSDERTGTGSSWYFCPMPSTSWSSPCILTCPHLAPQVRGHLPGGAGAEPLGLPAQRAHLLPGVPGHPAWGAPAGLVQRGLHEAATQHVPGDHPPQPGQR